MFNGSNYITGEIIMRRVRDMGKNEGRWHGDVSELIDKVWGLVSEDIRCETVRAEVGRNILSDLNAMRNMNPYDTHELHSGHEQMILKNTGYRKPYDTHTVHDIEDTLTG
tara:strand:+ start:1242 stop:1571 length:330 start_codon:yes stop_codon:yes gene_type:complete